MKIKRRHKIVNIIASPIINLYLDIKFRYKCKKVKIKPPFLVLCNHTLDFDPFFVAKAFSCPIYFVMSDHVSSLKVGKLIKHLVAPIPITKSSVDAETTRNIFEVIHQGGAVGMFPEGNKSFAGENSWIKPSTAKLCKKLGVPVVLFNIKGGYLSSPRWSKIKRKGKIWGEPSKILSVEDLNRLSVDEIYAEIVNGLRVNAYEIQKQKKIKYKASARAETIESLLYACPNCGSFCTVYGKNNDVMCSNCDLHAHYDEFGYLQNCALKTLTECDHHQKQLLLKVDAHKYDTSPIFEDKNWEVQLKKDKYYSEILGKFNLSAYSTKLVLEPASNNREPIVLPIQDIIGSAVEGACSLQLWMLGGAVYRLKNTNGINGLKYINWIDKINGRLPYRF